MSFSKENDPQSSQHPHSPIPLNQTTPPAQMIQSPIVASKEYIAQYVVTLENQNKAFESERALWDIERSQLLDKIAGLQGILHLYQSVKLPTGSPIMNADGTPTGKYRGIGRSMSCRTVSGPSSHLKDTSNRLHTTPTKPGKLVLPKFDPTTLSPQPNTVGADSDNHLNIPNLKINSSQPGSSIDSRRSPRESPAFSHIPPESELPRNLTKHAGHTPLARTGFGLDGTASALESDLPTPCWTSQEKPLEAEVSIVKPPSERSESYFPPSYDEDPELQEPLGLRNTAEGDSEFLNEVNSKLFQVEESERSPTIAAGVKQYASEHPSPHDEPMYDPPLKIKRTMNFGSQLGGFRFPDH
ncbi:MAG: hypothetical protein Q9222_007100 [Ikaeria aurantiellina]